MNAIPSEVMLETEPNDETAERGGHGLPLSATIYEFVVAVAALAAAVPFILRLNGHTHGWATFGILAAGAAASHTYTVRTAKDSSFHTSWVFLIPAAMLLPPEVLDAIAERVVLLLGAQHQHAHQEPWIGVDEAAAHLACPKSRVYRLVSMRKVPFHKDGARVLFKRSELDAWVQAGGAR